MQMRRRLGSPRVVNAAITSGTDVLTMKQLHATTSVNARKLDEVAELETPEKVAGWRPRLFARCTFAWKNWFCRICFRCELPFDGKERSRNVNCQAVGKKPVAEAQARDSYLLAVEQYLYSLGSVGEEGKGKFMNMRTLKSVGHCRCMHLGGKREASQSGWHRILLVCWSQNPPSRHRSRRRREIQGYRLIQQRANPTSAPKS